MTYFLVSSLKAARRRRWEGPLLRFYHSLLLDAGVEAYSFEACWLDYRRAAVAKLLISVLATVLYDNRSAQRRDWRREDLHRVSAFFEDHPVDRLLGPEARRQEARRPGLGVAAGSAGGGRRTAS